MVRINLIILASIFFLTISAEGQTNRNLPDAQSSSSSSSGQQSHGLGSPAEEIIHKAEIRHAEEAYREMVERADETAQLGRQLHDAFQTAKVLNREDLKRLERMEKLARKIRGSAGGDEDKLALKETPLQLVDAFERLADISDELKKGVGKTSRLVISGTVIERSNELIELIRYIRTSVHTSVQK
ncbi:MAG: hypothetical protein H0T60_09925 [Acidobacteria bacterium]|nr:hypothetical protein [Acidobacteriota bacterium]